VVCVNTYQVGQARTPVVLLLLSAELTLRLHFNDKRSRGGLYVKNCVV